MADMTGDEVRQVLRAYMQTHNIGVPALAARMKAQGDEVSLAHLNRFLDDKYRMSNDIIEVCRRYALRVTPAAD